MLRLAGQGFFQGKILASSHLYFSVVSHLSELFTHAKTIICLSNRTNAVEALKNRYPDCQFEHIAVGKPRDPQRYSRAEPEFLSDAVVALQVYMQNNASGVIFEAPGIKR